MSGKRKAAPLHKTATKSPRLESNKCPNPLCNRLFASNYRVRMHLSKNKCCSDLLFASSGITPPDVFADEASDSSNVEFPIENQLSSVCDSLDEENDVWEQLEMWDTSSDDDSDGPFKLIDDASDDVTGEVRNPDEFVSPPGLCFTPSDFAETKLLKILDDAHSPHFLYQDVLNWAKESSKLQYDFRPMRTTRTAQIKHIERLAKLQYCRPESVQLTLPGDAKVIPVTRFPFINMLYSLLSDPNLVSDLSNLDVNTQNPFGKYESDGGYLSTVNSGAWYHKAYKNLIKDPSKDFLLPICFACDETKLKGKGKTGCWPLLFSTTIFSQKLRNKSTAWRPLGYIYDLNIVDSKQERKGQTNDYKGERLHAIFRVVLKSFIDAQTSGLLDNVTVTLGGIEQLVNLRIPCVFIIGDMQGGDKICCSSAGYSNKMSRLCRKCNVRGDQSGDPFVACKRMSMLKILELVDSNNVDALNAINQYNVHSAWFDVGYGGCRFGIFSAACPVEALHALENGLMPDVIKVLFAEEMSPAQLKRLDGLAKALNRVARQRYLTSGSEPLMPRLRWSDGISSLSDLEAKYKVGIMLTIVVLTLQDDGFQLFVEVLGSAAKVHKMRQVFQMILCYWSWLKKDKYWKRGDKEAKHVARSAIQTMLSELMKLWPRKQGNGWEKAKIHEQLHVPDDIERNGAPQGWHSGPTENNHIASVKNYASQTNRRRETLDAQIGARNAESFIINTAFEKMTSGTIDDAHNSEVTFAGIAPTASKAVVYVYKENRVMEISKPKWLGVNHGHLHPWIDLFLKSYYESRVSENCYDGISRNAHACVRLFTEYARGGLIFRANPNYRQKGPWYDWAMFRWAKEGTGSQNRSKEDSCVHYGDENTNEEDFTYAPGQILGFLKICDHASPEKVTTQVIVLCCDSSYSKSSVFTTHWKVLYEDKAFTKPMIRLVSPDSIVRHCLMIPENDEWNGYHEVWTRERWAAEFCAV